MKQLDQFTAIDHVQNATCDACGVTGSMIGLWTHHKQETTPDTTVCPECFLGMDGRFRNQEPETAFAQFQDRTRVELHDDRIEIHSTSPFGEYSHVHYTEPAVCPVEPDDNREQPSSVTSCIQLTGESELFENSGDAIANRASFSDVATRAVLEENHHSFKTGQ